MFWHIMVKDHEQVQCWLSAHLDAWRLIQNKDGQLTSIGVPIVEIRPSYDLMSLKRIPLKSLPHVSWVDELMLVKILLFCNDKILSFFMNILLIISLFFRWVFNLRMKVTADEAYWCWVFNVRMKITFDEVNWCWVFDGGNYWWSLLMC